MLRLGDPDTAGGRELKRVGARKKKDLCPNADRRTRGTERETVLDERRERAGTCSKRRDEM